MPGDGHAIHPAGSFRRTCPAPSEVPDRFDVRAVASQARRGCPGQARASRPATARAWRMQGPAWTLRDPDKAWMRMEAMLTRWQWWALALAMRAAHRRPVHGEVA